MKAVFRYPGSKWSIAQWIIDHFPEGYEKMVYLEPFAGSGAVFFNKKPSIVETINDINGDVVNLFRCIRETPEELARLIALTPYSREEYDHAFQRTENPLEMARRFLIKTTQAIGAKLNGKSGWQNHKQLEIGGTDGKWKELPETIMYAAGRLLGGKKNLVQIENRNAFTLIAKYNSPDVLMYLDPPYLMETRKSGKLYANEMEDQQHIQMLEIIKSSKAKIILSGYDNQLYDQMLPSWEKDSTWSKTTSTQMAKETIWMNYDMPYEQMKMEE